MNNMDKQKVLNKFKKENSLKDEREDYLDLKSYSYGVTFSILTFLVIFILSKIKHFDYAGAAMMFLSIVVGNSLYKYIKDRKSMNLLQKFTYICFIVGGSILYIAYLEKLVS